jgi:hypothetical protein
MLASGRGLLCAIFALLLVELFLGHAAFARRVRARLGEVAPTARGIVRSVAVDADLVVDRRIEGDPCDVAWVQCVHLLLLERELESESKLKLT